jgi:hypothetical protein
LIHSHLRNHDQHHDHGFLLAVAVRDHDLPQILILMIFWLQVKIENQNIPHQKDQTELATLNGIGTLSTTGKRQEMLCGFLVVTVVVVGTGWDQLALIHGDLVLVVVPQTLLQTESVYQKFQRTTRDHDPLPIADQVV